MTDLFIEPDQPEKDRCGNCSRCITACPTGALFEPYRLDITRCISYHNIEIKSTMPDWIRPLLRNRIYGCDICQDVCPFNKGAAPHRETEFLPSDELMKMRKKDWLGLTEEQFNRLFEFSSVRRIGYLKLKGNIEESEG